MSKLPSTETVIKFARKFIPRGWQVEKFNNSLASDIIEGKRKGFFIFPYTEIKNWREDDALGRVEYMMFFENKSSWVGLWLFSHPKMKRTHWRATVVHEFAHIAVDRLFAMKTPDRCSRGIINSAADLKNMGEDVHGKYFIWAYELLCKRAERGTGGTNEIVSYMENLKELEFYKNRLSCPCINK